MERARWPCNPVCCHDNKMLNLNRVAPLVQSYYKESNISDTNTVVIIIVDQNLVVCMTRSLG